MYTSLLGKPFLLNRNFYNTNANLPFKTTLLCITLQAFPFKSKLLLYKCFNKYELNSTFQDKICRKSIFMVFAACGTDSELQFYGVILYAQ